MHNKRRETQVTDRAVTQIQLRIRLGLCHTRHSFS